MSTAGLRLGDWVLDLPLGRGGHAEVWRARSVSGGPVGAVKVLTGRHALEPRVRRNLLAELAAMALLDHPAIVPLLDQGVVDAEAARHSGDRMPEGSPYLVMPLLRGGCLRDQLDGFDWEKASGLVMRLLSALAHAHSVGVLHRDLKPANVLLPGRGDIEGAMLADFGLAARMWDEGPGPHGGVSVGTPAFMAPEQVAGSWRSLGPATDLYSLGCLTWALLEGAPPHGPNADIRALLFSRREGLLPPLRPRFAVPAGLERWLAGLLAREPSARFSSAAAAAEGLAALGPAQAGRRAEESRAFGFDLLPLVAPEEDEQEDRPAPWPAVPAASLPVPPTWRGGPERPPVEAGLGVLTLRRPPLRGREVERDRLWAALQMAQEESRLVLIEGEAGVGRSRLVEWLAERANELGCAVDLVVRCGASESDSPIADMLARVLRIHGLDEAGLDAWLARALHRLDPEEREGVAELLAPRDPPRVRFLDAQERQRLLVRAIEALEAGGPLVVVLDDVHLHPEAIALAEALFQGGLRVLVVLTVEAGALLDQPAVAGRLRGLPGGEQVAHIELGPLGLAELRALLVDDLRLDPRQVPRIEARANGNPRLAMAIVADQAARGLLTRSARGWQLARGTDLRLPAALLSPWQARLAPALADAGVAAAAGLELAAVLGPVVEGALWATACELAGHQGPEADDPTEEFDLPAPAPSWDLVEALVEIGLARTEESPPRWRFAHPLVREGLLANAAARLARWHLACADALVATNGPAALIADHLRSAGRPALAVAPTLRALHDALGQGETGPALALLDELDALFEEAGVGRTDERQGEATWLRVRAERMAGYHGRAASLVGAAREAARRHGWGAARLQLAVEAAELARTAGQLGQAHAALNEVSPLVGPDTPTAILAELRLAGARLSLQAGALEEARFQAHSALVDFEAAGEGVGAGSAQTLLGLILLREDQHKAAGAALREGSERYRAASSRWGMAEALGALGYALYRQGRPEAAAACMDRSLTLWEAVGGHHGLMARLHLALVRVELGELDLAEADLRQCRRRFQHLGWGPAVDCLVLAGLVYVAALRGDRAEVKRAWRELQAVRKGVEGLDPDVDRLIALAEARLEG